MIIHQCESVSRYNQTNEIDWIRASFCIAHSLTPISLPITPIKCTVSPPPVFISSLEVQTCEPRSVILQYNQDELLIVKVLYIYSTKHMNTATDLSVEHNEEGDRYEGPQQHCQIGREGDLQRERHGGCQHLIQR